MLKDENYITVMGWMRYLPGIETNNELLAYALIYGFSQVKGQYLTCNQMYIAEWLGIERENCNKLLKRMQKKKLVKKILVRKRGAIREYKYCCLRPEENAVSRVTQHHTHECRNVTRTSDETSHAIKYNNNIHNDFDNNIYIYNARARARGNGNEKNQNSYFDFEQHDYDFEQIEMALLDQSKND